MTHGAAILEVQNLIVRRGGSTVLTIPDFTLSAGERIALLGPNGAGKSTLLLALATLLKPSSGSISFRGNQVGTSDKDMTYRRQLAMVFQEPLLFDTTVFENVASGLKIRGVPRQLITQKVHNCMERFRISHLAGRSARALSGGEAQRTSLARAFATDPQIVLLDEPFTSLDPPTRLALMDDLEQVLRDSGSSLIIASHDRMETLRIADRVVVMQDGNIVQSCSPSEITLRPTNPFIAAFLGMENLFSTASTETAVPNLHDNLAKQRSADHAVD